MLVDKIVGPVTLAIVCYILDEKVRKLEGVLAVQVHVGPRMTIRSKNFFLKTLPDDLPLIKPEQAVIFRSWW